MVDFPPVRFKLKKSRSIERDKQMLERCDCLEIGVDVLGHGFRFIADDQVPDVVCGFDYRLDTTACEQRMIECLIGIYF